jgi:hypothetical protein
MVRKFLQSETFKVWVQYFAAGLAMIPSGVVYAATTGRPGDERILFALCVGSGLLVGGTVWLLVGRSLRDRANVEIRTAVSTQISVKVHSDLPTLGWSRVAYVYLSASDQKVFLSGPVTVRAQTASQILRPAA